MTAIVKHNNHRTPHGASHERGGNRANVLEKCGTTSTIALRTSLQVSIPAQSRGNLCKVA